MHNKSTRLVASFNNFEINGLKVVQVERNVVGLFRDLSSSVKNSELLLWDVKFTSDTWFHIYERFLYVDLYLVDLRVGNVCLYNSFLVTWIILELFWNMYLLLDVLH